MSVTPYELAIAAQDSQEVVEILTELRETDKKIAELSTPEIKRLKAIVAAQTEIIEQYEHLANSAFSII